MRVCLDVNETEFEFDVPPMKRLLDVLREDCRLTGTKEGCGEGECGACCVLMNGILVNSCLVPVAQANNLRITTVEGLSQNGSLSVLQESFLRCGAAQCGICTPGILMASEFLLRKNAQPSREDIRLGLSGNICRCTGYVKILDAVEDAARYRERG